VFGFDEKNIFLYGVGGRMIYWDGEKWDYREPNTIHDLFGMWGEDINHIYTVGGEGVFRFYNGKEFQRKDELTEEEISLFGVWGTRTDNVYICGSHGTLLHFNGKNGRLWNREQKNIFSAFGELPMKIFLR
jgi:hypothetical protein